MNEQTVIMMVQQGLKTIVLAAAPPLLLGLTVGVVVSIFQTVTSIQEPTLAFVPKILAVFLAIYLFGPWMMDLISGYTIELFNLIPEFIGPG